MCQVFFSILLKLRQGGVSRFCPADDENGKLGWGTSIPSKRERDPWHLLSSVIRILFVNRQWFAKFMDAEEDSRCGDSRHNLFYTCFCFSRNLILVLLPFVIWDPICTIPKSFMIFTGAINLPSSFIGAAGSLTLAVASGRPAMLGRSESSSSTWMTAVMERWMWKSPLEQNVGNRHKQLPWGWLKMLKSHQNGGDLGMVYGIGFTTLDSIWFNFKSHQPNY